MAKKNIVSIGMEIPGADIKTISLMSKSSLLDFDVIIIDPAIDNFYGYSYEDYQGKPCLDDTNSFRLKEHIEHWRREILEAIKAGKNVFLYLNEEEEVFVATGQKTYSGTGRNRQTTRHVGLVSNYQIIPGGIETTNSNGSSMVLSGKNNELAPYWKELGPVSEFRVLLDGKGLKPTVQTKNGAKIVGAKLRYKSADGNLFLMPQSICLVSQIKHSQHSVGPQFYRLLVKLFFHQYLVLQTILRLFLMLSNRITRKCSRHSKLRG